MAQNTTGATPFPLGVFVGNPNYFNSNEEASFEANFNAFSTLMKSKPQFLDQYGDQRLPVSQWVGQTSWNAASMAQSPVLKDVTPVIGLPMTSTASGSGTPDQFYKDFAAGKYDSVLKDMVKTWADNGFTTQIWRPGWEMNIDTMPSYAGDDAATRADWVKAFQHISTVLHAAGHAEGVNVQVAWNPSVVNYSHAGNVIETAYPGNQYVDIIAADVYGDVFPYGSSTHLYDWDKSGQVLNSSHPIYDGSVRQWAADPVNLEHYYTYPASNQWSLDGSEGHATTLQQLIDLAKSTGKPFAIAETSAGNTHDGAGLTDNPTFVQWLADTLHQSGVKVSFVNVWNSNSGGEYHFTSSADHKPLEAAAWAKYFGDPPTSASAPATTEVIARADTRAHRNSKRSGPWHCDKSCTAHHHGDGSSTCDSVDSNVAAADHCDGSFDRHRLGPWMVGPASQLDREWWDDHACDLDEHGAGRPEFCSVQPDRGPGCRQGRCELCVSAYRRGECSACQRLDRIVPGKPHVCAPEPVSSQ